MTEHIEKEKVMEILERTLNAFEDEGDKNAAMAVDMLAFEIIELPAADVAPVVHGEWVYEDVGWICSRCGMDALTEGDYRQVRSDYCPHCGARMYDEDKTVVHAYWRGIEGDGYDPDGNIVWDTFECSNCGKEHYADGEPEWDYCPHCGARMDGEYHG